MMELLPSNIDMWNLYGESSWFLWLPQKGDHEFHHRMESGTIMEYTNHMESYGMIWNHGPYIYIY